MTKKLFSQKDFKRTPWIVAVAFVVVAFAVGFFFFSPPKQPADMAAVEEVMSQTAPSAAPAEGGEVAAPPQDATTMMSPRTMGSQEAPIRIIEYASLTCSHCAHFHTEIFPMLKEKYIDTGKVFFEFREFPLNDAALQATIAARCLPPERYQAFIGLLFKNQDQWAQSADYMAALRQNAKLAGLSDAALDACFANQALKEKIAIAMQEAQQKWKVESTPTFIFNEGAQRLSGAQPLAEFERVFRALTNDEIGALPAVE